MRNSAMQARTGAVSPAVRDRNVGGREVTVLEGTFIEGEVEALNVVVHGHIRGTVRAVSIEVCPTGRVDGELRYESLSVAPGAQINARCVPA